VPTVDQERTPSIEAAPFPYFALFGWPAFVLSVYGPSAHMLPWSAPVAPMAAGTLVGVAAIGLLGAALRDVRLAGFLLGLVAPTVYARLPLAVTAILWATAGVVAVARQAPAPAVRFLNVFGAVLGAWGAGVWLWHATDAYPLPRPGHATPLATEPGAPRPDILVLLLDGYGRKDVLEDLFGASDTLPEELEARGFQVAHASHANYSRTLLAMGAAFNLEYVDTLIDPPPSETEDLRGLAMLIEQNRTVATLRQAGYRIVEYPSEFPLARIDADEVRRPAWMVTDFSALLYARSSLQLPLLVLGQPPALPTLYLRWKRLHWVFEDLQATRERADGPTFTFAHVMAPHPPFVLTKTGDFRPSSSPGLSQDGPEWSPDHAIPTYELGYNDQLTYVAAAVTQTVDAILADAGRPILIVILGDHGPRSRLEKGPQPAEDTEAFANLIAVRFPDGPDAGMYETISPVNVMRLVLERSVGARVDPLPDRAIRCGWRFPYQCTDVSPP
jgi:hypothetical protein